MLDVQHNAIVVDPTSPTDVYAGADIGVWRSTDSGSTWSPFSEGLPDAAVMDLKLHNPRRLLRVSTHGRGVYERSLAAGSAPGVELFVRDTQLDQGRSATFNGLPDPTQEGELVWHWRGPDIKLDTPDASGRYQFPLGGTIDFYDFTETLTDDFRNVATHATASITTRVYVQVHNRGVLTADGVQVMLLVANASAGLPALPAGYAAQVQAGAAITSPNWRTIGMTTLDDVRVGHPKVAAFDLSSNLLPPPGSLAGNDHHCVLALLHHLADPFASTVTVTDSLSLGNRKAAHKNLKVVQFTGTLPAAPVVVPVRVNNPRLDEELLTDLVIRLGGYRGRVRLAIPDLRLDGRLEELVRGLEVGDHGADFRQWADDQLRFIEDNQQSEHPYDREWSEEQRRDVERVVQVGAVLTAYGTKEVSLHNVVLPADGHDTVFLLLDRPVDGRVGEYAELQICQRSSRSRRVFGGLDLRVELISDQ